MTYMTMYYHALSGAWMKKDVKVRDVEKKRFFGRLLLHPLRKRLDPNRVSLSLCNCTTNTRTQNIRFPVNITIVGKINPNGKWDGDVHVHNCDLNNPKIPVDVQNTVDNNGVVFTGYIDDTIHLQVKCSQTNEETLALNANTQEYVHKLGFGYYKYHNDIVSWPEARQRCAEQNSHLVIINSQEEDDMLVEFIQNNTKSPTAYVFVGFHDYFIEGQYVTVLDRPLSTAGFWKWNPGTPNGGAGENCGCIHSKTGVLEDITCGARMQYICEKYVK